MKRRTLLALAGVVGTSGCLGYDVVEEDRRTERKVRIAELEATLERRDEQIRRFEEALTDREETIGDLQSRLSTLRERLDGLRLNQASLVADWAEVGDVARRATDSVTGDTATVAVNCTAPRSMMHSTRRLAVSVEMRNLNDEIALADTVESTVEIDPDQRLVETTVDVDVTYLPSSWYVGFVGVRDVETGATTRRESVEFGVEAESA
ncbi:hypothetical protein [Salinirubrum litoreum]|uniref:Uncharacterized protein n=1 Tax=Salinirubrum litoreum TaxID=1126234 RepID=A0ABD5R5X1_9EURY|nr:hypothetical protein [Salinirubrum litoreum]